MTIKFTVNEQKISIDADASMPLLWVLRDLLKLPGTKYGCGIAQCGVCTVHVDGSSVLSCVLPLSGVEGKSVTTIEGLGDGHPLQRAWIEEQVKKA